MSRHYYDVHQLMLSPLGTKTCEDDAIIEASVRHASMFFYRNNTGLDHAKRGAFRLSPTAAMVDMLTKDYDAMATMIFGDVPDLKLVLDSVALAETHLNAH